MRDFDPPGVHKVPKKLADGTVRIYRYAWRGGPRLPDPDPRNLAPYLAAYAEALKLRATPLLSTPQTVGGLIIAFRQGRRYTRLAPRTRREYEKCLDVIQRDFGTMPVVALASKEAKRVIAKWHDEYPAPRRADYILEVFSSMLSEAVEDGTAPANPAKGHERRHVADRSEIIWEPNELERLWPHIATDGARRAIQCAAFTGLRLGDIVGLNWSDVDLVANVIDRRTNKSKGRQSAVVPLLPEARRAIEDSPRLGPKVFTNVHGRPWAVQSLENAFVRARNLAGVKKRFHDLRGTAATMFASAGLSEPEIARVMGWSEAEVAAIMRRYVSRRHVAEAIVKRLRG